MERARPYLKVAAVVSAVTLVGALIAYRAGAFACLLACVALGMALARGDSLSEASAKTLMVAEGVPTVRSARFSSGLGVLDFMKRTSSLKCGPDQLRALGPAAITLGHAEGLDAHARSVAIRLNAR